MKTTPCPLCLLDLAWVDLLQAIKEGDEEILLAIYNEQDLCSECADILSAWMEGHE